MNSDHLPVPNTSVYSGWLMAIATTLEKRGHPVASVFARAGMDYQALLTQEHPCIGVATSRLWKEAVKETSDPAFGLTVPNYITATTFYALGFRFQCSATPLEMLYCLARFEGLLSNVVVFNVKSDGNLIKLQCQPAITQLPPTDEAFDAAISLVVRAVRRIVPQRPSPLTVSFRRKLPQPVLHHEETYKRVLKCPLIFDAESNEISWNKADLLHPITSASPRLAKQLDDLIEQEIRLFYEQNVSTRMQSLLMEQLADGVPTQDIVARQMNMSSRTLQRKLNLEHTSYQEVLDNIRSHLVLQYLPLTELRLGEISDLLGFRDQSSFTRWFKDANGHSPNEYRKLTVT